MNQQRPLKFKNNELEVWKGEYKEIVDLETNKVLTSKELESFLPPKKEDK